MFSHERRNCAKNRLAISWFAHGWKVRVAGVDHKRHAALGKTVAQRERRLTAKCQIDDRSGERRLLREPERIMERSGGSYGRPRGLQRSCNFHRDERFILDNENTAAGKIDTHDTTSANDGGLHGCIDVVERGQSSNRERWVET